MDDKTSWLVNTSARSQLKNPRQLPFQRIAQILNEDETTRRIEIFDHDNDQSSAHTSKYRFSSNSHLINCSTLKITIKRTWRLSSCALKYLQIWGSLSNSIPADLMRRLDQMICPPPLPAVPLSDMPQPSSTTNEIPSEFLDALTCDLMLIPMLLPSGYLIDRSTLEKCLAEDQRWSRFPRDPFTLVSFTEMTQPVVAQQLKLRIDQFLSEHQNDPKYRHYGRVLDPSKSTRQMNRFSRKRKLSDEQN